jgi:catechol 2,3-dioxygenase-like lactoylglutathione lyase family enzyme
MMPKPQSSLSLRHIALFVQNFPESIRFYTEILGMSIEWQPDDDNIYLTSGSDNLALHRMGTNFKWPLHQHLDHIGFMLKTPEEVDAWYTYLQNQQVTIKAAPRNHRDGARSFYCSDPDGNTIQVIYHPPLCDKL